MATTKTSRYRATENDYISDYLGSLVAEPLRGDDDFIDVVSWNLRHFNYRDPRRVRLLTGVMRELNADIFVLQEVEDDSLEEVAAELGRVGAGLYKTVYGVTGGDQLLAFVYDTDSVRAKDDATELFDDEPELFASPTREACFPRLPLHQPFVSYMGRRPFDFRLVGVHLKSSRGPNGDRRRAAAIKRLGKWLDEETRDETVLVIGDFNSPADAKELQPLQRNGGANRLLASAGAPSHLYRAGKDARLDLLVAGHAGTNGHAVEAAETPPAEDGVQRVGFADVFGGRSLIDDAIREFGPPVLTRVFFHDADFEISPPATVSEEQPERDVLPADPEASAEPAAVPG